VGSSRKSFVQAIASGAGFRAGALRGPRGKRGGTAYWPMMENPALQVGDAAAIVAAILAGAHIVRVHDVGAVLPAVRIADAVLAASGRWAGREVGR